MKLIETTLLTDAQQIAIYQLWNNEYPERLVHHSMSELEHYFSGLENKEHFLLLNERQELAAWCLCFNREKECWFAIIVNRNAQGKGYGSLLLHALKKKQNRLNGWVIDHENDKKRDGSPYPSPLPFYLSSGFKIHATTRLETEKISAVKISWQETED